MGVFDKEDAGCCGPRKPSLLNMRQLRANPALFSCSTPIYM